MRTPNSTHPRFWLALFLLLGIAAHAQVTDYRIDVTGTHTLYPGYDLFLELRPTITAGTPRSDIDHFAIKSVTVAPALPYTLYFSRNPPFVDQYGRSYNWRVQDPVLIRLQAPAGAPLGSSSVVVSADINGVPRTVSFVVTVLPLPLPVQPLPDSARPSIDQVTLTRWQGTMLALGTKWCTVGADVPLGYEGHVWYYDGARVYFQMADFTGNSQWESCGLWLASAYRDAILGSSYWSQGWRVFPRGLRMAYERTKDERYKEAVLRLASNSAYAQSGGNVSDLYLRETAYIVEAYIEAEKLGAPRNPLLARSVDYLLEAYDMLFRENSYTLHQTFFDGLAAEALIEYYDLTGDPRIPTAIKTMIDWVWNNGWRLDGGGMVYNPDPPGPRCAQGCQGYSTESINLVVPAFAWYYRLTGNAEYRRRGDELFAHALDTDISYSGKIFSQNYRWSPSYVHWRLLGPRAGGTGTPTVIALTVDPSIKGGNSVKGTVWLSEPTSRVLSVGLMLGSPSASGALTIPGHVDVPAGSQTASFTVTAGNLTQASTVGISASVNGTAAQTTTTVVPAGWGSIEVSRIYANPTYTPGNGGVTVYLTAPAPTSGVVVTLSSSNSQLLSVPVSVMVPSGASQAFVPITMSSPATDTSVTLTAKIARATSVALIVKAPDVSRLYANSLYNAGNTTVIVYLTAPAPAGGTTVSLTSSNSQLVSVTPSVVVPGGATQALVPITITSPALDTSVTLTAKVFQTKSVAFVVKAPDVCRMYANPSYYAGSTTVIVYLTAPAPAGGTTVWLTSSNLQLVSVPPSVVVPGGATQALVPITISSPATDTSVTLTATVVQPKPVTFVVKAR